MAVKSKKQDNNLILTIDNGDLTKLEEVMQKWSFKDYQGFMRFVVSALLVSEEKSISIKLNGVKTEIAPADDFIKDKKNG